MTLFKPTGWLFVFIVFVAVKFLNAAGLQKKVDLLITASRKININSNRRIKELESTLKTVSMQLMMQQFYVEEQTRSNGNSGLKQMRSRRHGTRPYQSASYVDSSIAAIHDHANNDRTIGMGELIVVLNGIEFRTRHNDYRLKMKSRSRSEYGAVEDIQFAKVPPRVTQHLTVQGQIKEMREWFKAWRDQDHSVRDYRPYFKPVLCYLEGSWTLSDQNSIDEPFDSDRHHFDAKSWNDLQKKIRFTSYSGGKDGSENFGYMPTTIMKLINETLPVLVQWNYDILCHPLSDDLPTNSLNPIDDLKTRMSMGAVPMDQYLMSRAARFQVVDRPIKERSTNWDLLDKLMSEVPGRDNYPGYINDTLFGDVTYPYNSDVDEPLNAAYYHRGYRVGSSGAMGLKTRHRGFSDENLFVAQTTQSKVASLDVETCSKKTNRCQTWEQRWSYAIPLEIIYLTPLSSWNPYNIPYRGDDRTNRGKVIYQGPKGRRNGQRGQDKAYNGTNSKVYYMTPSAFFEDEVNTDPADTTKKATFVLDSASTIRKVRASGHRIFLPSIPQVGVLRQRYPIMPVYGEGSAVWKELEALKDIILEPMKYKQMFRGDFSNEAEVPSQPKDLVTLESKPEYGSHVHHFQISLDQYTKIIEGKTIKNVITEITNGHSHNLTLYKFGNNLIFMSSCDGLKRCFDGHPRQVVLV